MSWGVFCCIYSCIGVMASVVVRRMSYTTAPSDINAYACVVAGLAWPVFLAVYVAGRVADRLR